jgi:formylglycine-generating enzyme required for sulfatase activity
MSRLKKWWPLLPSGFLVLGGAGCIDGRPAPELVDQVRIAYGPKVFLVHEALGTGASVTACTRLATSGSTPNPTDGKTDAFDPSVPYNCFVHVRASRSPLRVDALEITNDLYQLCVDSDACVAPDPSDATKSDVCSDDRRFESCPVVGVSQSQADNFCRWVGRRLPSGLEHVIMRQGNAVDPTDPSNLTVYPTGNDAPTACNQAVIGTNGCVRPQPSLPAVDAPDIGAASKDLVATSTSVTQSSSTAAGVYDLTGNVSEWAIDRVSSSSVAPWFCAGPVLIGAPNPSPAACPIGEVCVFGSIDPDGAGPLEATETAVCTTEPSGVFTGQSAGALFGGNWKDPSTDRAGMGTFGRRVESNPSGPETADVSIQYGFRCVGDLLPGQDPFVFEDTVEIVQP